MNQNLPKPMFEALGRQPLPTDHPSADVLTAFAENALLGDEYGRTQDHLSRCGECREIVFLATSTGDKPLQAGQVAAAYAARRHRMPRLVWGMSIAAGVLVVASSLMWWRNESARPQMQMASREVGIPPAQPAQPAQESQPRIESNTKLKSGTQSQLSVESKSAIARDTADLAAPSASVRKSQAKTPRANNVSPQGAETPGMPTPAAPKPATIAISGAAAHIGTASTTAPATPHANAFAPVLGGPLAPAPGSGDQLLVNPQVAVRSLRAAHLWRITADGHLEHSTAEGWTRVLADQSATFRAVSVVGNHVWVGGSGGTLFHSHDEGQNWEQVELTTLRGRETATIVSIQFDDAQHGIVTTDSGARCSTTNGGGSWNCQ